MIDTPTLSTVTRLDPLTGFGIVEQETKILAAPFTAPGDSIRIEDGTATLHAATATDRQPPPCPHFGHCGGCQLQHINDAALALWKRDIIHGALTRQNIEAEVSPTQTIPAASRRRARLTLQRTKKTSLFGFRAQGEHRVVDLKTCAILTPALLAALPNLRKIALAGAPRKRAVTLSATISDTGLDVEIDEAKALDLALHQTLATLAEEVDLARLVWNGELVAERRRPAHRFGKAIVHPPPGAFMQAAMETETLILPIIRDAIGDAKIIADLFSGCGTFALPLADQARVAAYDSDAGMVAALDAAARAVPDLNPVDTAVRDLFRRPLLDDELTRFDAVVIDPPRAGAKAQMQRLAASTVPIIVSISCNPATFARDARILCDGGYHPVQIVPIDQFRWSPHTEVVGIFRRL